MAATESRKRNWFGQLLPKLKLQADQVRYEGDSEVMARTALAGGNLPRLDNGLWACWCQIDRRLIVTVFAREVKGPSNLAAKLLEEFDCQSAVAGYRLMDFNMTLWENNPQQMQDFILSLPNNTRRLFLQKGPNNIRFSPVLLTLMLDSDKAPATEEVAEEGDPPDSEGIGEGFALDSHPFQDLCGDICEPDENASDEATDTCMSIEYDSDGTCLEDSDHDRTPQQDDGDDWTPFEEDDDGWVP